MVSTLTEYELKMQRIIQFLGGKCVKCGSTTNLQIDHVDHTSKSFTISSNWGRSWIVLESELTKCQLLCQEHHMEKTIAEGSLSKGQSNQPQQKHGTVWSYTKYKCRCDDCRTAKSNASKAEYLRSKNR